MEAKTSEKKKRFYWLGRMLPAAEREIWDTSIDEKKIGRSLDRACSDMNLSTSAWLTQSERNSSKADNHLYHYLPPVEVSTIQEPFHKSPPKRISPEISAPWVSSAVSSPHPIPQPSFMLTPSSQASVCSTVLKALLVLQLRHLMESDVIRYIWLLG